MVTLICFVKAKPGLSREEFHKYWSEVHGPLVAAVPGARKHTTYYAQYHRIDEDYDRPGSPDFDGVAIQSFDSMDEFRAFVAEPDVVERLAPDSPKFLDQQSAVMIFTGDPEVVIESADR
jgi:uncharacterized protein (TIGR02118 family)